MAICPFATWRPVVNHGGPVAAHYGLVVHVQQGDHSTFDQDNDPASEVSNTFWCGRDGTLEQMVDTDLEAWTEMAGNPCYSSVETEGFDTEALTDDQVAQIAHLFAWGHTTHGWPLQTCDHGGQGITTHAHYPSGVPDPAWGGHPCPGPLRSTQLPAIVAMAIRIVAPGSPVPPWPGQSFSYPPVTAGDDVSTWQGRMAQRGFHLATDGIYGPESKAACEAFQKQSSLAVDGIVGPITWAATWTEKLP